ncbi:MAG: thiamine biosynthesis protein-like protein [uncultured bacterium (gcode 4)]|uniref:Thiamine biosynthesis protein-like protein n=1 Tax=uncultured bacterium (gcode 4) TaxID=1234023 RepID=K2G3J4_9BACT|nr:MAG: thiamine biosynthesis protein-like protein [uncultured bacterium (gcode 4)]
MKALALFSGGLDSSLAINLIKSQWIEVVGLSFISTFWCKSTENVVRKNGKTAERFGFELLVHNFTEEQFKIIKNPKFWHGKNLNPCLDCHILMLKEAKKIMKEIWADFIITGEVLGQRPKSQRRETFPIIDKESDLEWLVLRPLSAKIMDETIPEKNGWVDREKLLWIWGRWRKTQISMAKWIWWEDFPTPAGWCLLTDLWYATRLKNIIKDDEIPPENEILLLTIWRHFNYNEARIIAGRKEDENDTIEKLASDEEFLLQVEDFWSPTVTIKWIADDETLNFAAWVCARYSDWKKEDSVKVKVWKKSWFEEFRTVKPLTDEETKIYIVW